MPINIKSLSVFKGKRQILSGVDLDIADGEVVCIAGRNGAGKTTLFRAMLGMEGQITGDAIINGVSMYSSGREKILLQTGIMLFPNTAYDYLSGRVNLDIIQRLYKKDQVLPIDEVVKLIGLEDSIDRRVKTYSAGMKQRLTIGMALINNPTLLILDEPFNSVDQESTAEIVRLLQTLNQKRGLTIVLSTHSLQEAESIYTRFVFIKKGEVTFNQYKSTIIRSDVEQLLNPVTALLIANEQKINTVFDYVGTTTSLQTLYQHLTQ